MYHTRNRNARHFYYGNLFDLSSRISSMCDYTLTHVTCKYKYTHNNINAYIVFDDGKPAESLFFRNTSFSPFPWGPGHIVCVYVCTA